ncbi:barstar family protein [Streptomyces sp. TLI_55]|uniref:barstar family protein n=1 Tax=Streptomyces sp. TLI_55 TaxID=1938861 RepID=UPI00211CA6D2|nr:barstar family protein [Streptomyces sp. TLI_55]
MTSDEDDEFWGCVRDTEGLFHPQEDGLRQVELLACSPQGKFLTSLDHLGSRRATAGGAHLSFLDAEGIEMGSYFVSGLTATAARPSMHGDGLFDIEVRLWCDELLPGSAEVWDLLRTGTLNRKGMWGGLDAGGRKAWLSVALWSREYQRRGQPEDAPPGQVFPLDGRRAVDINGFYCALGEAINGPGGYFGWNLAAVDDCLRGGFGAKPPFTLEWLHSNTVSSGLISAPAAGSDSAADLQILLEIFADHDVNVLMR